MKNVLRCVPVLLGLLLPALAVAARGDDLPMPQLVSPVRLPSQGGLSLYALSPTRMVRPNEDPALWKDIQAADHVELAAARNESEQFFLVLRPNQSIKRLQLRFIPDAGSAIAVSDWTWWRALSVDIPRESYWYGVRGTLSGEICDPLIKGGAFDAPANVNSLLLVQVHIPGQAKAGLYKGAIEVLSGENILARIRYQVTAWDITLPDTRTLQTMVAGTPAFGEDRPSWQLLHDNHVQWLKYGAAGLGVSYDKKTGRLTLDAGKYEKQLHVALDEVGVPRVALPPNLLGHGGKLSQSYLGSGIEVGSEQFWPIYDQFMKQMGDFYRRHGWASRIVFYMMDEINPKYYPLVARLALEARKQYPELQLLLVTDRMPDDLARVLNIWVVPWHFFVTQPKDVAHWDELRAHGLNLWAYMNSLYTMNATWTLSAMRFYPSVLAKYGYKGNLWWSMSFYHGQDPWKAAIATLSNEKEKKRHYGNGYLFYPPRHEGDSWSPSLRWESYEQGLDEYELLHMLHQQWAQAADQLGEMGKEPDRKSVV